MSHKCPAGCNRVVPDSKLMCGYHWAMVPEHLKRRVLETYKPGQDASNISMDYARAMTEAVRSARAQVT